MDFCQEIFNKITFGLLKQNYKYEYPKMKGWQTVKSPLQFIIPESDYESEMEECSIFNLYYFRHAGYISREINLIQDLKWVHDNVDKKYWRDYFYIVANNFSLRPAGLVDSMSKEDIDLDYYIYWIRPNKQKRRSNNSLQPIHRQRKKALIRPGMGKKQCVECTMYNLVRNSKCNFCGNKF